MTNLGTMKSLFHALVTAIDQWGHMHTFNYHVVAENTSEANLKAIDEHRRLRYVPPNTLIPSVVSDRVPYNTVMEAAMYLDLWLLMELRKPQGVNSVVYGEFVSVCSSEREAKAVAQRSVLVLDEPASATITWEQSLLQNMYGYLIEGKYESELVDVRHFLLMPIRIEKPIS